MFEVRNGSTWNSSTAAHRYGSTAVRQFDSARRARDGKDRMVSSKLRREAE